MTIHYRGVEIPTTARDWQLFTNKKAAKAAKELTSALKQAFLTFSFNARDSASFGIVGSKILVAQYTYSTVPTGSRWDEETFKLWDAAQKGMTTR
ncbi:MAG: hypothetical protein A3E01_07940 [Gammaproteobacteria bacterium RIFCSPHIGHO2_12_FULL_63_22]|nr:MAG: hypothetical protein A3E01_07940 [Gammaproteobacteria bacterium RIFCSPHIGHO2_12_FULL_63_22]